MEMKRIVRTVIAQGLKDAYASFETKPNGDNWQTLQTMMYAFQHVTLSSSFDFDSLKDVPVLQWPETVVKGLNV